MEKSKLIILVLSHQSKLYQNLEKCIRSTWGSMKYENVKIFYYYGGNKNFIQNDKIFHNVLDTMSNIGFKTLYSYEYLLKNFDFDYVFRTNSSSYVSIPNILEYLDGKPKERFYNGIIEKYYFRNSLFSKKLALDFVSGSGYFLSKDVVVSIVENKNLWNHTYIDDVSLGMLCNKLNILPSMGKRVDINYLHKGQLKYLSKFRFSNRKYKNDIFDNYHFRCKGISRQYDCSVMRKIHSKLYQLP